MKDEWMFNRGKVINFEIPQGVELPIYLIGDSHVRVLPEVAPYIFKSSQTDIEDVFISKTAYAIGNENYLNESINNIPKGSQVLLSFGEIDCRHYVPKIAKEKNKSIEQIVDEIIEKYTANCVRVLKERFRVIVLGAYVCPDDHNHENSFADIFEAKTLFNEKIEIYCKDNGILYVPLFIKSLENDWDTIQLDYPHYFNDSSHLGACMIPIILDSMVGFKWKGYDT